MSERPTAFLFDVMGTLVRDPFYVEVPDALGMTMDELLAAKHPDSWRRFEAGEIDEAELRRTFFRDGRDYPHEAMKRAMVAGYAWLPGMEALLAELSARGHALHLLSNYAPWYRLIEHKLQLSRHAAWSFVSCDMGVRKPDPRAYRFPAERLGCPPASLVFIDDQPANCEAAREEGLQAFHFDGAAPLRRAFEARGWV
ncbi:MAG: HAD family phosphatase [Myxococcales bacterium]|nr:HAD family phosphatase [Myxococcales bacterium]